MAYGHKEFTSQQLKSIAHNLEALLGGEDLATRPGPGNQRLYYVPAEHIITLANSTFGFNGWSQSVQNITQDYAEMDREGKVSVAFTAIVRITLKDGSFREDVGFGSADGQPKKSAAIEKAKKEAVTDAFKRAMRLFGNGLGNTIYNQKHLKNITNFKAAPRETFEFDPMSTEGGEMMAAESPATSPVRPHHSAAAAPITAPLVRLPIPVVHPTATSPTPQQQQQQPGASPMMVKHENGQMAPPPPRAAAPVTPSPVIAPVQQTPPPPRQQHGGNNFGPSLGSPHLPPPTSTATTSTATTAAPVMQHPVTPVPAPASGPGPSFTAPVPMAGAPMQHGNGTGPWVPPHSAPTPMMVQQHHNPPPPPASTPTGAGAGAPFAQGPGAPPPQHMRLPAQPQSIFSYPPPVNPGMPGAGGQGGAPQYAPPSAPHTAPLGTPAGQPMGGPHYAAPHHQAPHSAPLPQQHAHQPGILVPPNHVPVGGGPRARVPNVDNALRTAAAAGQQLPLPLTSSPRKRPADDDDYPYPDDEFLDGIEMTDAITRPDAKRIAS